MARALAAARRAMGLSSPNPAVGAVVVRDGVVVGEGFTQQAGGPHAEVMALRQAGDLARDAALYVSLEPCNHYGRTPPCAQAILHAGVREVHLAVLDPNPVVNGRGRQTLEQAGIRVVEGEGVDEAAEQLQGYFKHVRTGEPLVITKYAMTLDGKIATRTGDSRWVTGPEARRRVHETRAEVDVVLTAPGTVMADDPQLTARDAQGAPLPRQPLRVIADSRGRTPVSARLFREPGRTLVATASEEACRPYRSLGEGVQARAFPGPDGRVDLVALVRHLGSLGALQMMTEGGEALLGALFDAGLPDRAMVFIGPSIVGGDAASPVSGAGIEKMAEARRLQRMRVERFGDDLLVEGAFRWWEAGTGR